MPEILAIPDDVHYEVGDIRFPQEAGIVVVKGILVARGRALLLFMGPEPFHYGVDSDARERKLVTPDEKTIGGIVAGARMKAGVPTLWGVGGESDLFGTVPRQILERFLPLMQQWLLAVHGAGSVKLSQEDSFNERRGQLFLEWLESLHAATPH